MVMAASEEEEPSLTDALTSAAQPRSRRSKKHVCSPVLLTQTQQGLFCSDPEGTSGATWLDLPFILLASSLQEPGCGARGDCKAHLLAQQSAPKGSSCHKLCIPSPERHFRAGCSCLQIQGRCLEQQDGDGICVREPHLLCVP